MAYLACCYCYSCCCLALTLAERCDLRLGCSSTISILLFWFEFWIWTFQFSYFSRKTLLRDLKFKKRPFWRIDKFRLNNIIENGGWHFTRLQTPEDIHSKELDAEHHDEYRAAGKNVDKKRLVKSELDSKNFYSKCIVTSDGRWFDNCGFPIEPPKQVDIEPEAKPDEDDIKEQKRIAREREQRIIAGLKWVVCLYFLPYQCTLD